MHASSTFFRSTFLVFLERTDPAVSMANPASIMETKYLDTRMKKTSIDAPRLTNSVATFVASSAPTAEMASTILATASSSAMAEAGSNRAGADSTSSFFSLSALSDLVPSCARLPRLTGFLVGRHTGEDGATRLRFPSSTPAKGPNWHCFGLDELASQKSRGVHIEDRCS